MPRGLSAVLLAGLVVACASPTLPLPPPYVQTPVQVDATHVELTGLCGSVQANAVVLVTNYMVPVGQQASATDADGCGQWSLTVFAHKTDVLYVSQISQITEQISTYTKVLPR